MNGGTVHILLGVELGMRDVHNEAHTASLGWENVHIVAHIASLLW